MSYWPFSLDSQAEQRQSSPQQQSQHNTRSSGQPLLPPLNAGRGAGSGPRSPAALAASQAASPGRQAFFPPELTLEPPSPSHFEDHHPSQDMAESEVERLTRVATAAIEAATAAANALTAAQARAKKPELPPFDKKNVDLWIKRVESAYQRAGVTTPKDKFSFLEPKFPVDFNVKINDYLFGAATAERWAEFIEYLRDEFGKSKRQQAATLLSSHPRSGLKPTQFLINLKDKTKKITLDDIYKEILIKSLPADVQHSLVDKFEDMTADEVATASDKYFDNDGRPLSASSNSSTVNSVQPQPEQTDEPPSFTMPFTDDDADVNFVSKRQFSKNNKFGGNNNNNFRPKQRQGFSSASSTSFNPSRPSFSSTSSRNNSNPVIGPSGLCTYHERFDNKAQTCYQGCRRFSQHKGRKIFPGNDEPGRRT